MGNRPSKKLNAEKRRSQRLEHVLPLQYRLPGQAGFKNAFVCKDISGHGIGIVLKEAVRKDDKMEVLIFLDKDSCGLRASCRVAWSVKAGQGAWRAGLEFIRVREPQRLIEFVCEKMLDLSLVNTAAEGMI